MSEKLSIEKKGVRQGRRASVWQGIEAEGGGGGKRRDAYRERV